MTASIEPTVDAPTTLPARVPIPPQISPASAALHARDQLAADRFHDFAGMNGEVDVRTANSGPNGFDTFRSCDSGVGAAELSCLRRVRTPPIERFRLLTPGVLDGRGTYPFQRMPACHLGYGLVIVWRHKLAAHAGILVFGLLADATPNSAV
jgi:hypothetical protein